MDNKPTTEKKLVLLRQKLNQTTDDSFQESRMREIRTSGLTRERAA